jgi:hypothetical protein
MIMIDLLENGGCITSLNATDQNSRVQPTADDLSPDMVTAQTQDAVFYAELKTVWNSYDTKTSIPVVIMDPAEQSVSLKCVMYQ